MRVCRTCHHELPITEFYWTNHGHDRQCKECRKLEAAEWRAKHKERYLETARRWRENNRDKVRELNRRMWLEHGDKYAIKKREWALANKEKCRESERKWRAKAASKKILSEKARRHRINNPASPAAAELKWRQQHPDSIRAFAKTRRARKRGASIVDFTKDQWLAIQEAFHHRCAYCDRRCKGRLTQDHVVPLSKGGAHTASNIVPACASCNSRKNVGPPLRPVQPVLGL